MNQKEYNHGYYIAHKERRLKMSKQWKATHKARVLEKHREWRLKNIEKWRELIKKEQQKLKREILTYYGNGRLACAKCGFANMRALSIDHVNGEGKKQREEIHRSGGGANFYRWLKKENYPDGYQTLCMNCQFIKRVTNKEYGRTIT